MVARDVPDVKARFGRRLADLRRRLGWSQEQLALESGLARSYLGGVERGQRNIALENICRLADSMGMPPYMLLDFEDEVPY
jgi:transcriptional regulator with XRE-family HTH domain